MFFRDTCLFLIQYCYISFPSLRRLNTRLRVFQGGFTYTLPKVSLAQRPWNNWYGR